MEAAPLYEDVAEAPPGGRAWWVRTSDNVRIRIADWPPADAAPARGTVLLFPGRSEYIEKYGRVVRHYAAEGYAVIVIDWRGQGLSDRALPNRRLGHVGHFDEYQRDVDAFRDLVGARALPEPFYLVAHSMGGCIGLRALHDGLPVRAAAFSAPMWGIYIAAWEWPIAWASALLGPLLGLGDRLTPRSEIEHPGVEGAFEGNDLTTDRETWDHMKAQIDRYPDLALGGPTLSWLRAALLETTRLSRRAPPDLPVSTWLGTNERVVSSRAIRRLMSRWPRGRLEIADNAEHEIMMERDEIRQGFLAGSTALFAGLPGSAPRS